MGYSRAVSAAVGPRLILLSCSNGQKPTGIGRHQHPSMVICGCLKLSVLASLGFDPERQPIILSPI